MSGPFVGKYVKVVGTSRDELNGCTGTALDYDSDKGRYTVRLTNGQSVALKPANLEETQPPANAASSASSSSGALPVGSFQQAGYVLLFAIIAYNFARELGFIGRDSGSGGSSLFGGEDVEYDDRDEAYLAGHVREVTTFDQFRGALQHHSDNTGLPIVVDFFSHSCGPCRMIAPAFKRIAGEFKGRAVFLKVDVNRNYEAASACHVRGMPTFQFYLNKQQVSQFSGADERSLRRNTESIADQAEEAGTYIGQVVTEDRLRAFYDEHDVEKANESSQLAEKYKLKTAQLMRVCKKKYDAVPQLSAREAADDSKADKMARKKQTPSAKEKTLADFSFDELELEIQRRRSEGAGPEVADDELPFEKAEDLASAGTHKVVIIGGGPAGLAAAIYTARAGFRPVVVAPAFGGQLLGKGVDVENYPGVVGEHATGRGLVELMRQQARSFDTRFVDMAVSDVNLGSTPFRIRLNGTEDELMSHTVILACGAESRWLHAEGEQDFRGRGVSACATCDGFLFRGKDVVVVGGGDHAMEDALHLARTSKQVTLVHRRDSFRASKVLADRVLEHPSIKVQWNATVDSFHGAGEELSHVTIRSNSGTQSKLQASGAFVAIGHEPKTDFLKDQLEMNGAGYVVLHGATATSVPGVFAAGDVADYTYRQAATASGTGVMAALDAERYLTSMGTA